MVNKTLLKVNRVFGFVEKRIRELIATGLVGGMFLTIVFPSLANADVDVVANSTDTNFVAMMVKTMQNSTADYGKLPVSLPAKPRRVYTIPITAYSSEVRQTDDTPFITASGTTVRDGIVAANFLPIGTKVRIPELFGDKVFTVEDRMNPRYDYRMDIWMAETDHAWEFGLKRAKIEVF